jgi:hypothetical protein
MPSVAEPPDHPARVNRSDGQASNQHVLVAFEAFVNVEADG